MRKVDRKNGAKRTGTTSGRGATAAGEDDKDGVVPRSDEVDREVDRVLNHLRAKIRERGHTQLSVQKELRWGRSYISQLLTRQKALRVEQVLAILDVIGVSPAEFYAEIYRRPGSGLGRPAAPAFAAEVADAGSTAYRDDFQKRFADLRALVRGLVGLLAERDVIDLEDLGAAVAAEKQKSGALAWSEADL